MCNLQPSFVTAAKLRGRGTSTSEDSVDKLCNAPSAVYKFLRS